MSFLTSTAHRAWAGLTLREEAYAEMAERENPVSTGLVFVIAIALVVAAASFVGTALELWTSPDPEALQTAIWDGMQSLPWMDEIPPGEREEALDAMRQVFDTVWQFVGFFWPSLPGAALGIVTTPVTYVVQWLVFGLLAFAAARVLGGRGTLAETYGATALVAAPQVLGIAHVLPTVSTAGLGLWGLVCGYVAVKHVHRLSPGRAFWATLLPLLLVGLVLIGAMVLGVALAATFGLAALGSVQ